MRIENMIQDIIEEIAEIKSMLESKLKQQFPGRDYSVELPGLEDLSAIKEITLLMQDGDKMYRCSVDIHTHNDNRVFNHQPIQYSPENESYDPYLQEIFIQLIRDVVKRKKLLGKKSGRPFTSSN